MALLSPVPAGLRGLLLALLTALAAGLAPPATARAQEPAGEYDLKAAFLYNFAKFVEWPPAAFSEPGDPLNFCIVGANPFGEGLDDVVAGESAGGRQIRVLHPDRDEDLERCHLLFVPRSERTHATEILSPLKGKPVLTVGESDGFVEAGGMLRFVLAGSKLRFEINRSAIDGTPLKVSSKLLRLAVGSGEAGPGS